MTAFIESALRFRYKTPGAMMQSHHERFCHRQNLFDRGDYVLLVSALARRVTRRAVLKLCCR